MAAGAGGGDADEVDGGERAAGELTGGRGSAWARYRRELQVSLAAAVGTTALCLLGILILAIGMSAWSPRFWFSAAAIGLAATGVYAAGVDAPLRALTRWSFWLRSVIGLAVVVAAEALATALQPLLTGADAGDPSVLAFVWVLTLVPFAVFILLVRVTALRPRAQRTGAAVWGALLVVAAVLAVITG